jgi:hypothetical protein
MLKNTCMHVAYVIIWHILLLRRRKMDNQQPRPDEGKVQMLCLNARLGDGYFWKHPECVNYKLIYTSTTPELLYLKMGIAPHMFKSGVREIDLSRAKGRFPNAKQMYRLASVVSPTITKFKHLEIYDLIDLLTLDDLALWYLDDGSTIARHDNPQYEYTRTYLCIGNSFPDEQSREYFLKKMSSLFGEKSAGTIRANGSTASERNKVWSVPVTIAKSILNAASEYDILKHKFPSWVRFRDHSHGEVGLKGTMQPEAPESLNAAT